MLFRLNGITCLKVTCSITYTNYILIESAFKPLLHFLSISAANHYHASEKCLAKFGVKEIQKVTYLYVMYGFVW